MIIFSELTIGTPVYDIVWGEGKIFGLYPDSPVCLPGLPVLVQFKSTTCLFTADGRPGNDAIIQTLYLEKPEWLPKEVEVECPQCEGYARIWIPYRKGYKYKDCQICTKSTIDEDYWEQQGV